MWHWLIAVFFTLAYFLVSFVFVLTAKEASRFAAPGLIYLVASLFVLWTGFYRLYSSPRPYKTLRLLALGSFLLALAFPAYYLTEKYDAWRDHQIIDAGRNTQVFDLQDEPFLSAAGNHLGIRLRYSVRFPRTGGYAPAPRLLPASEPFSGTRGLTALNTAVEPLPARLRDSPFPLSHGRYQAGIAYRFTVEMVPFYLIPSHDRSAFCLHFLDEEEERLAQTEGETRYRIHVGGTSLDPYLGGSSSLTENTYRPRAFYDAALAEGARRPCVFDSQGSLK